MKEIILKVPYLSQYLDVQDRYWEHRSCGMTCVQMVLMYFELNDMSLDELVLKGSQEGGYSENGWKHDYFVNLFISCGLSSYRKEKMSNEDLLRELSTSIDSGNPIIVSVKQQLLGRDKYHMILVNGVKYHNDVVAGFFYHDPASLRREELQDLYVETKTFLQYVRGMAIFVSNNHDK
jgi:Peptidase_C39 like family